VKVVVVVVKVVAVVVKKEEKKTKEFVMGLLLGMTFLTFLCY
jgi:hypothetical protein